MKASMAAFWLLIVLIAVVSLVTILSIFNPSEKNAETIRSFFDIMKYVITLVGGGFLGVQIGEKYPSVGDG